MHDLIGMIIVDATVDGFDFEDEETIQAADPDKIYWNDEQYYRVGIEYDPQYDAETPANNMNPNPHFVATELERPVSNTYFDKYGNNYLLIRDTSKFKKNKKYYSWANLRNSFEVADVPEKGYEKNKYYYRENGNYILDKNELPTAGRQYYEIADDGWQQVANGSSVIWFSPGRFYTSDNQGQITLDRSSSWDENPNSTDHYHLYLVEDRAAGDDTVYVDVTNRVRKFTANTYYSYDAVNSTYILITEDAYVNIWGDDGDSVSPDNWENRPHTMQDVEPISLHLYTLAGTGAISLYAPGTYYYVSNPVVTTDTTNSLVIDMDGTPTAVIGDIVKDKKYTKEPGRTYFSKITDPVIGENSFYITNEYYILDNEHGDIEGDETPANKYLLSENAFDSDTPYYEKFDKYVYSDSQDIFPQYSKWNPNIVVPEGVQLCWLKDKQVFEELEGYARDKNTLNGLLLETHKLFGADDTRDTDTVHGAINTLKDLTNNFATVKAGETVVIDHYGRIHSAPIIGDD